MMLKLQAYREEFFAASGSERDETRLTADLNNSLGEEHHVALSVYHQNPSMELTAPRCLHYLRIITVMECQHIANLVADRQHRINAHA
jgi:hypothetical protein